ncbi:MAG: Bax inhibitor-1/YccA family protein, partial [Planctomycetota bacterium]
MRTSNPILRESAFEPQLRGSALEEQHAASLMTVQGTMGKTAILLGAVVIAASFTWRKFMLAMETGTGIGGVMPWLWGGLAVGFVLSLVISFKPNLAPSLALPYALAKGLFLGAVSAFYAFRFSGESAVAGLGGGIVFQAVTLTFTVAFAMLGL